MPVVVHVPVVGDHFSPRHGSAVSTVVAGLVQGAGPGLRVAGVLVQRGTMVPYYTGAKVIEYDAVQLPGAWWCRVSRLLQRLGFTNGHIRLRARRLAAAADAAGADFVIVHNDLGLAGEMARQGATPVVLYAHNDLARWYWRPLLARRLQPVEAVVAVSGFLASQLSRRLGGPVSPSINAVLNGVDLSAFTPVDPKPKNDALKVIAWGRVVPEKGFDIAIEAVAAAQAHSPARCVELTILGSSWFQQSSKISKHEKRLRELAEQRKVRVRFIGAVDRDSVPSILREHDVGLITSRWAEPCSLTAAEGMASGLAIVATDVGGLPEVVGTGGEVFSPTDVRGMGNRLRALADDDALLRQAQIVARTRSESLGWDRAAAALESALL